LRWFFPRLFLFGGRGTHSLCGGRIESMNSDRRHELHQNVLETYFSGLLKKIEPHTKLIAVAFASVVAAAVAYGLFQNSKTMAKSDATLELLQNANGADAEALATVGDRYANTVAGTMARLFEADSNLGAGITALFTDREEGQAKIEDAIKAYKSVTTSTNDKLLLSRANFGLARAYESLGETKEAISAYQSAASTTESEAIAEASKQRIALLEKSETQEFLTWFSKQDFKPADPAMPPSFPDGQRLPDLPDLDLPEITPMKVPDELKASSDSATKPANENMSLPAADAASEAKATEPTDTEKVELVMPPSTAEAPATVPSVATPSAPSTSDGSGSTKEFVGDNAAVRVTDEKK